MIEVVYANSIIALSSSATERMDIELFCNFLSELEDEKLVGDLFLFILEAANSLGSNGIESLGALYEK